jgi:hypothetical protein
VASGRFTLKAAADMLKFVLFERLLLTQSGQSRETSLIPRNVAQVHLEELSSWPTKRLLGRLKALRKLEESPEVSDFEVEELREVEGIVFKSDPRWSEAYKELKSILDGRENVRSGKTDRIARMKTNRR